MRVLLPIVAVLALTALGFVGWRVQSLNFLFAVVVPYAAIAAFLAGFVYRIVGWARSPVPFRITTTCGQEKTFGWIKQNKIDNPYTTTGVLARMALEVLTFRSLFRNTSAKVEGGPRLTYSSAKWLWLAGIAFHWSFLVIFVRHFRLFADPIPMFVHTLEGLDGFLQITLPTLYLTDLVLVSAVTYLFIRRIFLPQLKYISLAADYFPLLLIIAIATSGILMRYITKTDIISVKALVQGLVHFSPVVPKGVGGIFYVHLFLVSSLLIYFPMSKLMHMGGVFMSPTRNLANNSRAVRHINPWNPDIKFHTYAEYEDDFRKVMKGVGLPLDKETE